MLQRPNNDAHPQFLTDVDGSLGLIAPVGGVEFTLIERTLPKIISFEVSLSSFALSFISASYETPCSALLSEESELDAPSLPSLFNKPGQVMLRINLKSVHGCAV